jgi:hypothetical protein
MEPVAHRAAQQLTSIARQIAATPEHDPLLAGFGRQVLDAVAPVEAITNEPFGPMSMYHTHDLPEGVRLAHDAAMGLQLAPTPEGSDIQLRPILDDLGRVVELFT